MIESWEEIDKNNRGGDYSNDVIARAQWLVKKYNWTFSCDIDDDGKSHSFVF